MKLVQLTLTEAQLHALRTILIDYTTNPHGIQEFHRVIEGDTVTLGELLGIVGKTCDDAMVGDL